MKSRDRLIVALDRSSRGEILEMADALHGVAGVCKIGLQAFIANGPGIVKDLVARGHKVFLDLKLHDIPNTVAHAVEEASKLAVTMTTLHAAGGTAMMAAAAKAVPRSRRPILLGVTVLTSMGESDLAEVGLQGSPRESVERLALLARGGGLDGVVASPLEIAAIRKACGAKFVIVTPGIRAATDAAGDQKRTMTAREAIDAGADYIVVGRPITEAKNPREAARELLHGLEG